MTDEPKGLKFYLCQTPDGPQYIHLQADAKKLDPNYETTYVDTSKQAIMERLNALMRGPIQGVSAFEMDEEQEDVVPVARPPVNNPLRSPEVVAKMERVYDQIEFEEFIWRIPDNESYRFEQLESIIESRRWYLAHPGERRNLTPEPATTSRPKWGTKA